jgi:lipopolysaccharide biosynthesis glycosyltransferase
MTDYSAYDSIYNSRPIVRIHKRLRSNGTVKELIDLAKKQNYRVEFSDGSIRHDLIIYRQDSENPTQETYDLISGVRYFRRLNDS